MDGMITGLIDRVKCVAAFGLNKLKEVLHKFWAVLINWFNKAIQWVEDQLHKVVLGGETFLKKVGDEYQEFSYHYSQNSAGNWERDTVIKQKFVSEDEIPADILALAAQMEEGNMLNITQGTDDQTKIAAEKLAA